ncbi:MAG: tRNA (guanosine(37)-N1)-methyltransferase TrmD [bacterium]
MLIEVVTLFPEVIEAFTGYSILRRACDTGLVKFKIHPLRSFGKGRHLQVDDYRFGGGPGMLLMPEPLFAIMESILTNSPERPLVIVPSAQGKPFRQDEAKRLSQENHLIFICGHYKGIDQRVIDRFSDVEYSVGDYVLSGGELAAAVIIDATIRLIPGVLGDWDSARGDSFYQPSLDAPHYTRPEVVAQLKVPEVLLSGNHRNIFAWRQAMSSLLTRKRRPDLERDLGDKIFSVQKTTSL